MQDGEYSAIPRWIEKLVGVPARRERSCFGLAITNNAADEKIGIVECSTIRV